MSNEGDIFGKTYNPDVLSCLANLSNDEVFTPPDIVNKMLDLFPEELWTNPDAKFLDPCCKTGVFLREIAKRLLVGLGKQIPNLQERIDHIFQTQLYGIAITEMTGLLSRRSVYCSKYPNSKFSVSRFQDVQGNIQFDKCEHKWNSDGKCITCGASKEQFGNKDENHAYEFIHITDPEELFKMKFDVIIGNPPYQLETGGAGKQAKPIYNLFVEQAKKLNPRFLVMIIPSRWFCGGMGLDSFRQKMMKDEQISQIVDFANAKDCFPQNSISGGVCYFLWERGRKGNCTITNIINGRSQKENRSINEFPIFVRYNEAVEIIRKIVSSTSDYLGSITSGLMPYGLSTNVRGEKEYLPAMLKLHASDGVTYIKPEIVTKGTDTINVFKVLVSKTGAEHAGEPGKDGKFRVLTTTMKVIGPKEVCTHSYFVVGNFQEKTKAENVANYLKTKFVRFLILQTVSSYDVSKQNLLFVPMQDFSHPWTDEMLYEKYGITKEEQAFIDSMIRPMDSDSKED